MGIVVEQEDLEEAEVALIGMGDSPQQLLVSEGKGSLEGSCWSPDSLVVHCFHIAVVAAAVVANFLAAEADWHCQRVSHSAASAACLFQDSRIDRS